MEDPVVIVSAVRTPIGRLNGTLSSLASYELGAHVIKHVLERVKVNPNEVDEVIMGQVLTACQGQNPARHAAVMAGIPHDVPSCIINQVCGSGIRSVAMAMQSIKCQDSTIVVAGGQESMSNAPHCMNLRSSVNFGNKEMEDSIVKDGLTDCFHKCSMGETAENVAKKYNISRSDLDTFALSSQMKVKSAYELNYFNSEIVPITVKLKKETVIINKDEHPRPSTTIEGLTLLRPAFLTPQDKTNGYFGTVTAGNSSGINDGAAAVVVMSKSEALKRNLSPLAEIVNWAHVGVDPLVMGLGPIPAIKKLLQKCSWSIEDVDLFEVNEAFASQSCAVMTELNIPMRKLNIHGGAIALGHPLGASGTRIIVALLHAMQLHDAKRGVAALCVGGGMGVAMAFQRS